MDTPKTALEIEVSRAQSALYSYSADLAYAVKAAAGNPWDGNPTPAHLRLSVIEARRNLERAAIRYARAMADLGIPLE